MHPHDHEQAAAAADTPPAAPALPQPGAITYSLLPGGLVVLQVIQVIPAEQMNQLARAWIESRIEEKQSELAVVRSLPRHLKA
jgi:hypothetical protein